MAAVIRSCIRVMCVDDHPIIRQGLSAVLASDPQLKLVSQVATAENAIDAFRRVQPDVTLMDLHLPCMTGAGPSMSHQAGPCGRRQWRFQRWRPATRASVAGRWPEQPTNPGG